VLRRSLAYGELCLAVTLGYVGLTAALGIAVDAYLPVSLALLLTIIATQLFQAPRWLEGLADYGVERGARYAEEIEGAAYFV
jgi:hypothetical protein